MACSGEARPVEAWRGGRGWAGRGLARLGKAGKARRGEAWRGEARHGMAGVSRRGLASHGVARRGGAWRGEAGTVVNRLGEVRRGTMGRGMADTETSKEKPMKKAKGQEEKKVISKCLEQIQKANGTLTPDLVVKHAKNKSSPLHRFFEWDDSKAAEAWRLVQGRNLIGTVWIEIETTDEVIRVPKYVRDPRCASDEQGYCPIVDVKNKDSVARDSLGLELDRVRSVLERALHIADFLGLSKEVSRLLKTTTKLRERLIAA